MNCRFCDAYLKHSFVDLGMSPLCESFLNLDQTNNMEPFYPLHVFVCDQCFLVQLQEYVGVKDIFSDYAYFSSYSESWVQHAKKYSELMIDRFQLNDRSLAVEIASNDGYLLQHFVARKVPVLGIEPAANVVKDALKKSIPTVVEFFGERLAHRLVREGTQADLLLGNNVLAQVPDLRDFVKGMKVLLKPGGVITMEFPHLLRLVEGNQFDTIYHEHFSYFSLFTVEKIFKAHDLSLFDVEQLPTHGGSLRIFVCHSDDSSKSPTPRVKALRAEEEAAGVTEIAYYSSFAEKVKETKRGFLEFLIRAKKEGKSIVGYGAPGKGNTFLNYSGIRTDFIDYTVDRNPHKHGKFLPGTHIPIFHPDKIKETKPDYIVILPWNLKDEIMDQLSAVREWGAKWVVAIPDVQIF